MNLTSAKPWLVVLAALLVVASGLYWLLGRSYGTTSQQGYQFAMAVCAACNQKSESRLRELAAMVDESLSRGELSAREARWLASIVNEGLDGNWEAAHRHARQLMEDQLERATPLPTWR